MLNQDLFMLFVLTIIIAAFLGMALVLKILQSLPSIGGGFGGTVVSGERNSANKGSSGFGGALLLLIIIATIFWLLFLKSIQTSNSSETSHSLKKKNHQPRQQKMKDGKLWKNVVEKRSRGIRINQKPSRVIPYPEASDNYSIQVCALSTIDNAKKAKIEFRGHYTEIILDDDDLYKILIGDFSNRFEANTYKNKYGLEGFVKRVSS